jgi:uncharacterized protein (TIGR03435 family)
LKIILRSICKTVLATAIVSLFVGSAYAQAIPIMLENNSPKTDSAVRVPTFDVASVKPNKSGSGMMRMMVKQDGFSCENISLKNLIASAYVVRQDLISGGPGWVESQGFDVDAKVAAEDVAAMKKLIGRERNSMLQSLLADRFHLKVHIETKVLPIYDLVVAKGGSKLTEVAPADVTAAEDKDPEHAKHPGMMTMGPGMLKGEALQMLSIANQISYVLEKTIIDNTGLKGKYDIDLKWTPEEAKSGEDDGSSESGASIFTAVQEQLGLKLVSTKGPVETLVIDHVELPSEN